jgi:hypothetical protein
MFICSCTHVLKRITKSNSEKEEEKRKKKKEMGFLTILLPTPLRPGPPPPATTRWSGSAKSQQYKGYVSWMLALGICFTMVTVAVK